jgi:hypothetical protein
MAGDHLQCCKEQCSACWATAVGRRAGRTHGSRPAGRGAGPLTTPGAGYAIVVPPLARLGSGKVASEKEQG